MDLLDNTWITGFAAAIVVSLAAWRLRALNRSGAIASAVIGGLVVGAAGWWAGGMLVTFFVTASALSRVPSAERADFEQVRGSRRDWIQVLANGGLPAVLAVASALGAGREAWLVAYAAAVSAATADTWATETGRIVGATPRILPTWDPVTPGTSGAVSGPGTLGAGAGAALIAGLAAMGTLSGWWDVESTARPVLLTVGLAGFAGSIADSLLGATVQAMNWCPLCRQSTELTTHTCGTVTVPDHGLRWVTNDVVNALAIAFAAVVGLAAGAAVI